MRSLPRSRFFAWLCAGSIALIALRCPAQPVILAQTTPPPAGTVLHEEVTIDLLDGTFSVAMGKGFNAQGAARAHVHDTLQRTWVDATHQTVSYGESVRNILFGFGTLKTTKDQVGQLTGHKLAGQKNGAHWTFEYTDLAKPEGPQQKALQQFDAYMDVLVALEHLYGSEPHQLGDTWKPDLSALQKTALPLESVVQCKWESTAPGPNGDVARIGIQGSLGGKLNERTGVRLEVQGFVLRRLSDLVDERMELTGNFLFKGELGKDSGPLAEIKAPLKFVRVASAGQ